MGEKELEYTVYQSDEVCLDLVVHVGYYLVLVSLVNKALQSVRLCSVVLQTLELYYRGGCPVTVLSIE